MFQEGFEKRHVEGGGRTAESRLAGRPQNPLGKVVVKLDVRYDFLRVVFHLVIEPIEDVRFVPAVQVPAGDRRFTVTVDQVLRVLVDHLLPLGVVIRFRIIDAFTLVTLQLGELRGIFCQAARHEIIADQQLEALA